MCNVLIEEIAMTGISQPDTENGRRSLTRILGNRDRIESSISHTSIHQRRQSEIHENHRIRRWIHCTHLKEVKPPIRNYLIQFWTAKSLNCENVLRMPTSEIGLNRLLQ